MHIDGIKRLVHKALETPRGVFGMHLWIEREPLSERVVIQIEHDHLADKWSISKRLEGLFFDLSIEHDVRFSVVMPVQTQTEKEKASRHDIFAPSAIPSWDDLCKRTIDGDDWNLVATPGVVDGSAPANILIRVCRDIALMNGVTRCEAKPHSSKYPRDVVFEVTRKAWNEPQKFEAIDCAERLLDYGYFPHLNFRSESR